MPHKVQIGETIIAPDGFKDSKFIKLNNRDKTLLDNTTYANLVPYLKPNLINGTLEDTIINPAPLLDDNFGNSVSVNSTGTRLVIGASKNDPASVVDSGSVYIYLRTGSSWTIESTIDNPNSTASDNFGNAVDINSDGTRVIIGAYQEDPGAVSNAGSAYIYSRSGTTWSLEDTITKTIPVDTDNFGIDVSIDSTGTRVIIGAYLEDTGASGAGSAYVYSRSGTTWTLEQEINNPSPLLNDQFGNSVSIDSTGTRLIIAANRDDTGAADSGSAYVYSRSNTTWTLEQEINNPSPLLNDQFGNSVSIDSTGTRLIIAANRDDTGAADTGSVYIYSRSGTIWTLEQEINNPSPVINDYFGNSVIMNSDGSKVIIAAQTEDTGADGAGTVYVYSRSDTTWTLEQEINNPSPVASDFFGTDVSIDSTGTRVVISAIGEDTGANQAGSVYIYDFTDTSNMSVTAQGLNSGVHKYLKHS